MFRSQDIQVFVFLTNSWGRREKKNFSNPAGWGKRLNRATAKLFLCQKLQFRYFLK